MTTKRIMSLAELPSGLTGRIVEIAAGRGLSRRIQAIGVRLNKKITKISGMPMRGPVVIQVGGTRVGLGHGMARKVMVEIKS